MRESNLKVHSKKVNYTANHVLATITEEDDF